MVTNLLIPEQKRETFFGVRPSVLVLLLIFLQIAAKQSQRYQPNFM
jgi:hypothetical protein